MSTKKIKLTTENFGNFLLESMDQALDHAKGLRSEGNELPKNPSFFQVPELKNYEKEYLR